MTKDRFLKTQLVWTGVVYGILFTVLISLLNQKFEITKTRVFGANAVQPQIFLN